MTQFPPTGKQKIILEFIRAYMDKNNGLAPSIAEITEGVNASSKSVVQGTLKRMRVRGLVDWIDNRARTLVILAPEQTPQIRDQDCGRIFIHSRRRTVYQLLGIAEIQSENLVKEGDRLCIYQGADGKMWARPESEFKDGRFKEIIQRGAKAA